MNMVAASLETTSLAADDPRFSAALELQLAQMRRVLDLMGASTGADALRVLRNEFQDAALDERVRAVAGARY